MSRTLRSYSLALGDVLRVTNGDLSVAITDLADDSRRVRPGSLFIAVNGAAVDGRQFINQAIERGAAAVACECDVPFDLPVPSLYVHNDYQALGRLAEFHYGFPAAGMTCIGVTGTNGKTTTAFVLKSILEKANRKVGLIGSIRYDTGEDVIEADRTTPSALRLQELIYAMRRNGVEFLVMEVSSHALVQHRVGAMKFDVAIFTNLTPEHLDYHKSLENYYLAKRRLFAHHICQNGLAVVNMDDLYGARMMRELYVRKDVPDAPSIRLRTYGFFPLADVCPSHASISLKGCQLRLHAANGPIEITHSFIGKFNTYNIMAAVTAAVGLGVSPRGICSALAEFEGIPGRLQRLRGQNDINIFVDYAHTDDALEQVLLALKPHCKGPLVAVFGCGGDRDRSKRSRMGNIAGRLADELIVTSDNPRSEDPDRIISEILRGIPDYCKCKAIPDRRSAISLAIRTAAPNTTILIAGKGHENYQEIRGRRISFDDTQVCREALSC